MFFKKVYVSMFCVALILGYYFFFHDFIMFNLKETKRQT